MRLRQRPWLALGGGLLILTTFLGAAFLRNHPNLALPCPLKAWTGLPCLSCGSTRCVLALTRGQVREAFAWHPLLTLGLLTLPPLMAWDTWRAWRGKPFPDLSEKGWLRAMVLSVLAVGWLLQVRRGI